MTRIGVIIQCRMNSERLPGKVLLDVHGRPMLAYLLDSMRLCEGTEVIVATSDEPGDDPVAGFCADQGVAVARGPLASVADRFAGVVRDFRLDAFVRICGDSPLMDYRVVNRGLDIFRSEQSQMVSNVLRRTFPKGQSVEILRSDFFLEHVVKMISPEEQEHVTRYFYDRPEQFAIRGFEASTDMSHVQLSVDTPEDMIFVQSVVGRMERPHWEYTYEDLLAMREE